MRIVRLPATGAWCLMFGPTLADVGGRRLFDTRTDLEQALDDNGLVADRNGVVSSVDPGLLAAAA